MTIEEELFQALARITVLEGDLTAANDLLGESQAQAVTLTTRANTAEASVARLTGELATANTNLSAVTAERDGYKTAIDKDGLFAYEGGNLSLTADGKTKFVNAEATRVVAGSGHAPMPLAVDNATLSNGAASASKPGPGRTKTTWNK